MRGVHEFLGSGKAYIISFPCEALSHSKQIGNPLPIARQLVEVTIDVFSSEPSQLSFAWVVQVINSMRVGRISIFLAGQEGASVRCEVLRPTVSAWV